MLFSLVSAGALLSIPSLVTASRCKHSPSGTLASGSGSGSSSSVDYVSNAIHHASASSYASTYSGYSADATLASHSSVATVSYSDHQSDASAAASSNTGHESAVSASSWTFSSVLSSSYPYSYTASASVAISSSGVSSSGVSPSGASSSGVASPGAASSGTSDVSSSGASSSGASSSGASSSGASSSGSSSSSGASSSGTASSGSGVASSSASSSSASSSGVSASGVSSSGASSSGVSSSGASSSGVSSSGVSASGSSASGTSSSAMVSSTASTSAGTSSASDFSAITSSASTSSASTSSASTSSASATATFGNTASTRSEWGNGFDIDTDYYLEVPETGVTREYWFELTDGYVAPDGVTRYGQTINGTIPGPTIHASWGDNVIVHLNNALTDCHNGTSLHFHGIRQNYTNDQDGVSSITQCPVAPGNSVTYKWRATQYGTSWYHSHFALQAWQGVFGPIVIEGPASANYDVDAGTIFLNDWTHQTPDALFESAETQGPPNQDNGLINGMNVWGDDDDTDQTGERWNTTFTPGTSYLLRIVNGAIDSNFKFSIDNHTLTVISSDFVAIEPYTAKIITVGMGQRYNVIVTADQEDVADSFWMRAIPQAACSDNTQQTNIKAVVYYEGSNTIPTTTGYDYVDGCDDETDNLVPVVPQTVGIASTETVEVASVGPYSGGGLRWFLNSTTMITDWKDPSLLQIYNNVTDFEESNAVIVLDEANVWTYLVIETQMPVSHPIHLHGHDFVILAQGSGTFDDTVTLNTDNPPRRDVAMLPSGGYLALAFYTDNPGAWLMHCHIGWHTSEGFALQFIERQSEITATVDTDILQDTCDAWSTYQTSEAFTQEDSGI